MLHCAAEQGDGGAANDLGNALAVKDLYREAVKAFQLGVKAGDSTSASFLESGFNGPEPSNKLDYLALPKDPERARRYEAIWKMLSDYSYASPTVPEINDIVPLPPAPLPAWDGKIKWLEDRKANIPPTKPSEALIEKLAKDKQLNPTTGRPLPTSPDFDKSASVNLLCKTGEPCPKSGYWQIAWLPREGLSQNAIIAFREGDIMPTDRVEICRSRPWPLSDKLFHQDRNTNPRLCRWALLSCLLLAACNQSSIQPVASKEPALNQRSDINANLAFTCKHETIPESSADTDVLFKYARWLQKNNLLNPWAVFSLSRCYMT